MRTTIKEATLASMRENREDVETLTKAMATIRPFADTAKDVTEVWEFACRIHRVAIKECNKPLSAFDKQDEAASGYLLTELLKPYGATWEISDPRGCVRIKGEGFPDTGWGDRGDGTCVPTELDGLDLG